MAESTRPAAREPLAAGVTVAGMTPRILLVEDDEKLGQQVVEHLREAGLEVTWLKDGNQASVAPLQPYSLVILDLMLPGTYGLAVLRAIRRTSDVPVLVLSARNETTDKVRSLKLGADDYVTKPFWPEELVERVRARLRRPTLERSTTIHSGDLAMDTTARRVQVSEQIVELTRVEFDLLAALARRPRAAVTRGWLLENVLDAGRDQTERALDAHVSRLRKKLGRCGSQIVTVWGVGYRFEPEGSS